MREKQHAASATSTTSASVELLSPSSASANEDSEYDSDINVNCANKCKRLRTIVSAKLSSTLDCTNTTVRKSAMVMAFILNEFGTESVLLPSKSTIHRQRQ